jgi:4-amino-4-deoxy-L-arabinose transferase-like glycosyltransferase
MTDAPSGAGEPSARTLAAQFVAFVALWSAYFAISESSSAIHNDMAEAYVWGREFQLGYNQHPPFWAWICGAWFTIFPRTGWAFAILSSLNAGVGLIGAWRLIGRFARGEARVAATSLLLLTPFYTFLSYKYNANSIFLSIWPWTMYFFVRSIDDGRRRDAIAFGIAMGLALLSKYYAGVLGATCLLAALQHPERARYFRSGSPHLSIAVAAALFAPHVWWLATTGAPPLRYLERVSGRGFGETAFFAATAVLGALAQNALAFAIVALAAIFGRNEPKAAISPRRNLLATLALAPIVLSVVAALALRTKISTNMLIGVFPLMPLLAIELAGARGLARLATSAPRLAGALCVGALIASPAVAVTKAWWSRGPEETQPREEIAVAATKFWEEKTGRPLAYVAGSFRYDNAVAFYSEQKPHVFVGFDYFGNRWVTPRALARNGLLSVCVIGDAACAASTAGFATDRTTRAEITLSHRFCGHARRPVTFVLTAIPPSGD